VSFRPSRLEPIFDARPWGVHSLAPLFPERKNLPEKIGEAWMTGEKCRFADGPFAGETLQEAWKKMPAEWTGTSVRRDARFPILVKFIFTSDKLSVQVHPDDDYAAQHETQAGGRGKTEMWYCIDAEPGAEVMVGLKPEVTRDSFDRAIREGTAEKTVEQIPLRPGEAIFVPAGTVHTIGAGLTLCEIQQQSDLTYRVYDYNRRDAQGNARALHIEKALDVIQFGKQRGGKIEPAKIERSAMTETFLAACNYFATEKYEFATEIPAETSHGHFDLVITISGRGGFVTREERIPYAPAQVWLLPAALGKFSISPASRTEILRTYVPGPLDEFSHGLEKRGFSSEMASRLVHK
jgi:mannose-6-phosphate isomerase